MATLRSLLASSKSSSSWGQAGSSGWGSSSSTWGGKRNSSYVSLPTFGKKRSSSQATADAIMARTKGKKNSHSGSSFLSSVVKVASFAPDVASNLVTDLVDTAENLPSGLYKTATTNPIDTAKAVGADYGRRYGPLFHGQFGKFASEVAKHPLAPLLDVATVATLGAATGAKAGLLSGELETTGLRASRAASIEKVNPDYIAPRTVPTHIPGSVRTIPAKGEEFVRNPKFNPTKTGARGGEQSYSPETGWQPKLIKNPEYRPAFTETTAGRTEYNVIPGQGVPKIKAVEDVQINLPRNPMTRQVSKAGHQLKRILPERIPVLGEAASAKRNLGQQYLHDIGGQDAGTKTLITQQYKAKYGEQATEAIQKYAQTQVPGGILGKSTQLWKDAVLAGRPAFQVNNFVGNHLMYHLGQGLRQFGASKSLDLARKGELNTAFNDIFGGTAYTYGHTEAGVGGSTYRRMVNKSYNLQGKDELMLRKATMRQAAMANPEIRTLTRKYMSEGVLKEEARQVGGSALRNKKGAVWAHTPIETKPAVYEKLNEADALTRAIREVTDAPGGQAIKREIQQKIEDTLGNYSHYNKFEAGLKRAVPFYGWNRHSTRFLYSTMRDRPDQILGLYQLGKMGEQQRLDTGWQGTPAFMRGYLDILGHTIDTAPLNPIKGATDTLKLGRELVKGNVQAEGTDIGSSINPLVAAGIQGLTGKNLLTGAPVPRTAGGLLGSVINQTAAGLPQVRLAGQALPGSVKTQLGVGGAPRSDPHHFLTPTGRLKTKYAKQPIGPDGLPEEPKGTHMLNPTFQSQLFTFFGIADRGKVNREVARTVQKKIETQKSQTKGFHAAKKRAKKPKGFKAITQSTTRSGGWGASSGSWGG